MTKADRPSSLPQALPPLPEGWRWAALGDIAKLVRNGTAVAPREEDGVPILRISAVRPLALDMNDLRYLSGSLKDFAEFEIEPGDLLFTRYNGNPELVGACAVVPAGVKGVVHPDKLIIVVKKDVSISLIILAAQHGFEP